MSGQDQTDVSERFPARTDKHGAQKLKPLYMEFETKVEPLYKEFAFFYSLGLRVAGDDCTNIASI